MKWTMNVAALIFLVLNCIVVVCADEPLPTFNPDSGHERTITIDPAVEPTPALTYYLRPSPTERKPGDAASFYYRAILTYSLLSPDIKKTYAEKEDAWLDVPIDKMPLAEIKAWLAHMEPINVELRRAIYRDHCDWGLQLEQLEGLEGIELRLPEMQEARGLARMLSVKARVEIAERRYDDAIETLRTGFQLGYDVARPKTLINALVGMAICRVMQVRLEDLIDAPGSPNMYWALTALPRPLIDSRVALEQEMSLPVRMFPVLKDPETSTRSVEEWKRLMVDAVGKLQRISNNQWTNLGDRKEKSDEWVTAAMMVAAYPKAKQQLLARGYNKEQVEAMPTGQVIAMQASYDYEYSYQQTVKWSYLPYWQAHEHIHRAARRLKEQGYLAPFGQSRETLPVASILMPATNAARVAEVRTDQGTALLQTVEAIGLYTAQHDGQLPKSLADLKDFPALRNPYDNQPFHYELKDGKATVWGYTSRGVDPNDPTQLLAPFIQRYTIIVNK